MAEDSPKITAMEHTVQTSKNLAKQKLVLLHEEYSAIGGLTHTWLKVSFAFLNLRMGLADHPNQPGKNMD
jgi:hypothetical protein